MCNYDYTLETINLTTMYFFWEMQSTVGLGLLKNEISKSHTTTHQVRYDASRRVISSSQKIPPDNTQHS